MNLYGLGPWMSSKCTGSGAMELTKPYKFIAFGGLPRCHGAKQGIEDPGAYKLIGFLGAGDVTKPNEFIKFGAMDVTKPYNFMGFGAMDVTMPDKFTAFGGLPRCHGAR